MQNTQLKAVICAAQRSGTTALQNVFRRNGYFCPGEVFHPDRSEADAFLPFLNEMDVPAFDLINRPEEIWQRYNRYLETLAGERDCILDIKYNSWHHFNGPWQQPVNPPRLLSLIPDDCAVIHIVRDDVFAQVMSGIIAQRLGKFHNRADTDLRSLEFTVNARNFQARVKQIDSVRKLFTEWLSQRPNTSLITYEDMYRNNKLTSECQNTLRDAGLKIEICETALRKPKTDFSIMIRNYDELKDAYAEVA